MQVKLLLLLPMLIGQQYLFAQFNSGKLQATGLTCALCSNAINKSLEELPFVQSVKSMLKESAFVIKFKPGASFHPGQLREAVEDAGFFVGELVLTGKSNSITVNENGLFQWGQHSYHLVSSSVRQLDGEIQLRILNKSFLTDKSFKKVSSLVNDSCSQSGQRIYHLQLVKS
jgi:copper chaperone CopZ